MKRDFELIRKILAEVSDAPAGCPAYTLRFPGEYDDKVVFEHVALLIDAGLIEGNIHRAMSGIHDVRITRLTWDGQEFLDAAAEDTRWRKAIDTVKEKGGAMTFEVLKELLKRLSAAAVGLS